jgi:hypothetical protein
MNRSQQGKLYLLIMNIDDYIAIALFRLRFTTASKKLLWNSPIRKKASKRLLLDVLFMSFLTLQCVFFCYAISKKNTPKILELATFSSASAGFLKSSFRWFFTLNYYFFCNMKTKNTLIQVFFIHSRFNNIII